MQRATNHDHAMGVAKQRRRADCGGKQVWTVDVISPCVDVESYAAA